MTVRVSALAFSVLGCMFFEAEAAAATPWIASGAVVRGDFDGNGNLETVAVDLELSKHGDPRGTRANAPWRRAPVPADLRAALQALRPSRSADNVGTAIAHLALARALAQSAARR